MDERPARLYLCARCRIQVVVCSRCDRGNRYCGRACWRQAREGARREAASRYQRSQRGRMAHAARARRWRQRAAARHGHDGAAHNVTHQGCQPGVAPAPLRAWPHDTTTSSRQDSACQAPDPCDMAPDPAPAWAVPATWYCCGCARAQPQQVRQGFLRHGMRAAQPGWRHDHSP
jgi:hypothetical protein